jgi:hypothetical protein
MNFETVKNWVLEHRVISIGIVIIIILALVKL